jgi:hypothetical protein
VSKTFKLYVVEVEVEVEAEVNLQPTVSLSWCRPDFCFLSDDCGFLDVGHPL